MYYHCICLFFFSKGENELSKIIKYNYLSIGCFQYYLTILKFLYTLHVTGLEISECSHDFRKSVNVSLRMKFHRELKSHRIHMRNKVDEFVYVNWTFILTEREAKAFSISHQRFLRKIGQSRDCEIFITLLIWCSYFVCFFLFGKCIQFGHFVITLYSLFYTCRLLSFQLKHK